MVFKGITVIACALLLVSYTQTTNGLPRDSSVLKTEDIVQSEEGVTVVKLSEESLEKTAPGSKIAGRVWCQYEEATEDSTCQEHCLPKGYSYGICVRNTCSCI